LIPYNLVKTGFWYFAWFWKFKCIN